MKKTQVLFAVLAMFLFGCAIPLARVEARQDLPLPGPQGCAYETPEKGQPARNYVRVGGLAYDPGRFYEQVSDGNAQGIYACADLDMVHDYGAMYKTYAQTMLASSGQGDEGLKKDLDDTKAAVKELSDNVVDLATIASPQAAGSKGKLTVVGKLNKGKQEPATATPSAPTPVINAPPPAANPAPIDPTIAGRIMATHTNAEIIGVLRAAARADSANAPKFNGLANSVARGSEDSFGQNQKTLAEAFAREGVSR